MQTAYKIFEKSVCMLTTLAILIWTVIRSGIVFAADLVTADPASSGAGIDRSGYARELIKCINKERVNKKIKKLKWDKKLLKGTAIRAREISRVFSHRRPGGGRGTNLLLKYVKKGRNSGECIGRGDNTPAELARAFINSPSHRKILMSKRAKTVAVSLKVKEGQVYWAVGVSLIRK